MQINALSRLTGVNRKNFKLLSEEDGHIWQCIEDILTTPIGSRIMRREYGSLLPKLIDRPMTDELIMQVYAATALAVMKHEPRIRLTGVSAKRNMAGTLDLTLEYLRLNTKNIEAKRYFTFSLN